MSAVAEYMTPPELARKIGVSPEKIIAFISAGQLDALDMAAPGSTRPRWFISPEAITKFERLRSARPTERVEQRRRQAGTTTAIRFI